MTTHPHAKPPAVAKSFNVKFRIFFYIFIYGALKILPDIFLTLARVNLLSIKLGRVLD
jgi:hypothetical protein